VRRGGGKYCSKKCLGAAHKIIRQGENGPNWKGGTTPKGKLLRMGADYRFWRESIFARDNWTCQDCVDKNHVGRGKTLELHAHHIFSFADFPEHRFALWNGITLCVNCHRKYHFAPSVMQESA
jgi:hypothetical protein